MLELVLLSTFRLCHAAFFCLVTPVYTDLVCTVMYSYTSYLFAATITLINTLKVNISLQSVRFFVLRITFLSCRFSESNSLYDASIN
jgi:hypothetical protein